MVVHGRKQFNIVKRDLFPWSKPLSQNVAKNAIIHTGKGLDAWGTYKKALKKGRKTVRSLPERACAAATIPRAKDGLHLDPPSPAAEGHAAAGCRRCAKA